MSSARFIEIVNHPCNSLREDGGMRWRLMKTDRHEQRRVTRAVKRALALITEQNPELARVREVFACLNISRE